MTLFAAVFVSACAQTPGPAATAKATRERPSIVLRHGSDSEKATEEQLGRLFDRYDMTPWLFTRAVLIDEQAAPHSHPTLTLHTRHLRDDLLLLATFIHEQSHWYLEEHQAAVDAAVVELRALAPGLPVGFPEGGETETSTYEHLIVIALEERGVSRLAGELAAREVMEFWASDHYRALYRTVLEKRADIWRIMRNHGLAAPAK
ncbi:hypothetical protein BE08_23995 [Sorangium cellulosum]|uniref:Uncharacterized protein n=1 Tax=Sorangium cellulosum TaxID=56 RepID=A0A150PDB5_SORCE|nr:hypothetical protein BE08_23995 [Sorangium cellulosum]